MLSFILSLLVASSLKGTSDRFRNPTPVDDFASALPPHPIPAGMAAFDPTSNGITFPNTAVCSKPTSAQAPRFGMSQGEASQRFAGGNKSGSRGQLGSIFPKGEYLPQPPVHRHPQSPPSTTSSRTHPKYHYQFPSAINASSRLYVE